MVESTSLHDFLELFEEATPLALLAVKAPVGFVTGSLADTYELRQLVEDGQVRELKGRPNCGRWVSVVQLQDDPWTFVVWASGTVVPETQAGLGLFAEDLSESLGTEAVTLLLSVSGSLQSSEQDQGPVSAICVYDNGEPIDRVVVSANGTVLSHDESDEEEAPDAGGDVFDKILSDLEIRAPACVPDSSGDDGWLAVSGMDPERVARVDLLEGNLRLPTEEETLDMVLEEGEDGAPRAAALASRQAEQESAEEDQAPESVETDSDEDDTRLVMPSDLGDQAGAEESNRPGLVARISRWFGQKRGR